MRTGRKGAALAVLLLLMIMGGVPGPDLQSMSGRTVDRVSVPEPTMEIHLDLQVRIGDDGPGAGPLGRVAVSPDSSIFAVIEVFNPTQVNLYGENGQHLRTLGGTGDGPGEFQNAIYLTSVGDSLFVYDNVHARETVFGLDGTYHRSSRTLRRLWHAIPLGEVTIVNGFDPHPERAGAPLHTLRREEPIASFPGAGGRFRMDELPLLRRPLTRQDDSEFWAAWRTRYQIDLWSVDGEQRRSVRRDVPWFPDHNEGGAILPDVEPKPRIYDVFHAQVTGHLWVVLHVPDPRWSEQFDPGRPGDLSFTGNMHGYWNTVVEVFDADTGGLLASREFDRYFSGFSSAGHLMSYMEPLEGEPSIELHAVRVQ